MDQRIFMLGPWRINPRTLQLSRYKEKSKTKNQAAMALTPQALKVLQCLCQADEYTLSKDELIANAWPDRVVSDEALTQIISALRRALEDSSRDPKYIQTISRVGYRLLQAPVYVSPNRNKNRYAALFTLALVLAIGGSVLYLQFWRYTGTALMELEFQVTPLAIAAPETDVYDFDPQGKRLAQITQSPQGQRLIIQDINTGSILLERDMPAGIEHIRFSTSGNRLALLSTENTCEMQIYDLNPFKLSGSAPCNQSDSAAPDWLDEDTLAWVDRKPNGQWDMITLSQASVLTTHNLDLTVCDKVRDLKSGPQETGFICEKNRSVQLVRMNNNKELTFSRPLRDIGKFEWLTDTRVIMNHITPWKSGVTQFDIETKVFSYTDSQQLDLFRSTGQGDLLAKRRRQNLNSWQLQIEETTLIEPLDYNAAHGETQVIDQAWTELGLFVVDDRSGDMELWFNALGKTVPAEQLTTGGQGGIVALAAASSGTWLALTRRVQGEALQTGLFQLKNGQLNLIQRFLVSKPTANFTPDHHLLLPEDNRWVALDLETLKIDSIYTESCTSLQRDVDGNRYCSSSNATTTQIVRLALDEDPQVLASAICANHWSLDSRGIWFSRADSDNSQSLYRYRFVDQQTQQIIRIPGPSKDCHLRGFSAEPGGLPLYFIKNDGEEPDVVRLTPITIINN